jgi:hypothetical protein
VCPHEAELTVSGALDVHRKSSRTLTFGSSFESRTTPSSREGKLDRPM